MKSRVWGGGMRRYVIPRLPGEWDVASRSGRFLYRRPANWLACCVTLGGSNFSTAFDAKYLVVLLAKPDDGVTGRWQYFKSLGDIHPYWPAPAPTSVEEAEGPMLEILDLIRDQALPYFDRFGTLATFAPLVEADAAQRPENFHFQEELFCLQVIRGDLEAAVRTADVAESAARDDGSDWALAVGRRVRQNAEAIRRDPASGIRLMRAQVEHTRSHLGITPDDFAM
ncbi:hypothetical protein [Paractinoplanes maris]|uniref:hypothetical protein n=1 Tax=Paractinoplanes maris TaxID=1734446 RepID=UPI002020D83A|nr:hypothetical protein [Actinoplanes maris]